MKKMKKEKIYIVEDDEMIVQLLKQHLGKSYQVESVQNFRAVSQEVAEIKPDLVLMDINLPYYNGFYWTTEIRKTMTMPIIFISSSDDEMNAVMAMNMGGDDFVSKPFSLGILDAKSEPSCVGLINSANRANCLSISSSLVWTGDFQTNRNRFSFHLLKPRFYPPY